VRGARERAERLAKAALVALFVGLDLDAAARDRIARIIDALRALGVAGRFERIEKLHVTIAYLGNVQRERFDEIAADLETAAAQCAPFALSLDRLGAFPDQRNPRLLWLGSTNASAPFDSCARAVREAYARRGFSFDKPALPHVTVCRSRRPFRRLPSVEVGAPIEVVARELALFESLPAEGTTRYAVRLRAPLGRREPNP